MRSILFINEEQVDQAEEQDLFQWDTAEQLKRCLPAILTLYEMSIEITPVPNGVIEEWK